MKIDRTAHQEVVGVGSVLDRSLHVLQIAQEEFNIDGLKPSQIAAVLTEKFRIKTSRQAVQQALDSNGDKVDRVPQAGGAIFRIMAKGEAYLKEPTKNESPRPTPKKPKKKSSGKKDNPTTAKHNPRTGNRSSGRPGPKQILESLIGNGYFQTPRTISAIQTELKESRGHSYKSTDLSPALVRLLRDKTLSRSKNSDGQYEYKN